MTRGVIITTDKEVTDTEVEGLKARQDIVGGLIEPVTLSDGSTMWVNEDGIALGLPFNSIATDVCGIGGRPDVMLQGVRGNVLIVGPVDREGSDTDLTDLARRWVTRVHKEA